MLVFFSSLSIFPVVIVNSLWNELKLIKKYEHMVYGWLTTSDSSFAINKHLAVAITEFSLVLIVDIIDIYDVN